MPRERRQVSPASASGGALATFLVGALGLAVVLPGMLLPSIATRTRERATEEEDKPGDGQGDDLAAAQTGRKPGEATSGPEPLVVEVDVPAPEADPAADGHAALLAAATANAEAIAQPAAAGSLADSAGKPSRRAHRVTANPSARRKTALDPEGDDEPSGTGLGQAATEPILGPHLAELATDGVAGDADDEEAASKRKQDRQVARLRQRQEAKAERREQSKASTGLPTITYEEGQAAHAAMVRHIGALTANLNEAHRIIGRLNMEKYQAQKELAIAKKLPLPPPPPDPSWIGGQRPGEPRAVRQLQRNKHQGEEEYDPEVLAHARSVGRRRQMMFAIALAAILVSIYVYRTMGWNWFPDITDREAMTQIAGIGVFIQLIFVGWIFYRFARIGGKGARWLFPSVEEEQRKMRRKQR